VADEGAAAHARQRQNPAAYRVAIDLYTGDLLPEDRYDNWANARREALRQEYIGLLLELAQLAEASADDGLATACLQRVLAGDSANEPAHRGLMRLYALAGARQQALRQYQALQEVLRRELDIEPAPESQRLYHDILSGNIEARDLAHTQEDSRTPAFSDPPISPHNLPLALTSFVGREREIAEVQRLLTTTRMLMLAGPGGSGKTRLALEAAAGVLPAYRDGAWLVELAALAESALVPLAVAAPLGVREAAGQPLVETLAAFLRPKQLLMLLDNCEHLVGACAPLAEALLRTCPQLRILATSREPLHIPGEVTWLVPGLSLPDPRQLPPPEDLLQYESPQLFVERAQAVTPSFRVADQHAAALAQICARLDGMPLAIELAAARVGMLTLDQLAQRLDDCFRLLVGGSRTALSRQQTLKATLDWSYDLLAEQEQVLLRRLAVFAGGWTLEAADAICAGSGIDTPDVLELLARLADKSLVMVRDDREERRYWLLEPVRQYSAAKLSSTDEEISLRARHLDWYLAQAERARPNLRGPSQEHWKEILRKERDNCRTALEWCFGAAPQAPINRERGSEHHKAMGHGRLPAGGRSRIELGLRLADALAWFWYFDGALSEGRTWFERALARIDEAQRTWARAVALDGVGFMAMHQGDLPTARMRLVAGSAILRELSEPHDLAMALFGLSIVAINQGDDPGALAHLEQSLELFRAAGDQEFYALTLMHMGDVALRRGEAAAARDRYEQALSIQRQLGSRWGAAQVLNNLGEVARYEGDYARAGQLYEESLALFKALGSSGDIARSLHNLGYVANAQGDQRLAAALFAESLALFRERGNQRATIESLVGLAAVISAREQPPVGAESAARLLGAGAARLEALGAAMWPADRLEYQRNVAAIRATLGEEAFGAAWAAGRALTLEQAIEQAIE
jgi:predicted ATPase/Tfp pilus assembly protein PilF